MSMNDGPTESTARGLRIAIDKMVDQVENLRRDNAGLRRDLARIDKARKTLRVAFVAVVVVTLTSMILGSFAVWELERFNQDRVRRSIGSCIQANDFIEKHNDLVHQDQQVFRDILENSTSDSGRQFAEAKIKAYDSNLVEPRDCTVEGIEKYLSAKN